VMVCVCDEHTHHPPVDDILDWEYDSVRWVRTQDLRRFESSNADGIISPLVPCSDSSDGCDGSERKAQSLRCTHVVPGSGECQRVDRR
jgi:hypothetical protein